MVTNAFRYDTDDICAAEPLVERVRLSQPPVRRDMTSHIRRDTESRFARRSSSGKFGGAHRRRLKLAK